MTLPQAASPVGGQSEGDRALGAASETRNYPPVTEQPATMPTATTNLARGRGRLSGWLAILVACAAMAACTERNPNYCDDTIGCKVPGQLCKGNVCVAPDRVDAGAGTDSGRKETQSPPGSDADEPMDVAPGIDVPSDTTGPAIDGGSPIDTAAVDLAPPPCKGDGDCTGALPVCGADGMCKKCADDKLGLCKPLFCSADQMSCVPCQNKPPGTCTGATSACDSTSGQCVECTNNEPCTVATKPICDLALKKCGGCKDNEACKAKNPMRPACLPGGDCAECDKHLDCPMPAAAACEMNKCVPCTTDDQCAGRGFAGLCLTDPDGKAGRCATEAETIHVRLGTGCSTGAGGTGTAATPFCQPRDAVSAVTATKRVMLITGPGRFDEFLVDKGAAPLYIVGKNAPSISGGATAAVITVRTTDVRIRGLTIENGQQTGLLAQGSAILRLNGVKVLNNALGGIIVNEGAGYDIANTLIAGNKGGTASATFFGGAYLGERSGSRPMRFRFNTVVDNEVAGVVCATTGQDVAQSIVYRNAISALTRCKGTDTQTGDPQLTMPPEYKLTGASPCKDKIAATLAPPEDIEGERRPKGALADCGADEL